MQEVQKLSVKVLIGLGNPGPKFSRTRHNIGFIILDALAAQQGAQWHQKQNMLQARIQLHGREFLLIKPQTFMNDSGAIMGQLAKDGIKKDDILVIHDELELPFGKLKLRLTGSAKGHNGLKSIIAALGPDFARLGFGISRPENREEVPDYVLSPFNIPQDELEKAVASAVSFIESTLH
jgi:PTH1 family peptidyl-tRNA hydrolase